MVNVRSMIALYAGKFSKQVLKLINSSGTALPGKLALRIDNNFLDNIEEKCDTVIMVTGTNGKTTTNNLLNHVIGTRSDEILSNLKGANMIQGIATTYVNNTKEHYDYGIFEVDEGTLRGVTRYVKPDYILVSNFFRDQLDRFGEIDNLVEDVYTTIEKLPESTLILNVDDPLVNKFT